MLSFLNPWFLLGAFALAAPVWLHLRRKQQINLHYFSAIRFLEDQPEPKQGPLRLRDLLLFLLRALALLLIVGAFAWPYLRGPNLGPIQESRVYILDNTLSRQAQHGFERDRDHLVKELRSAGPGIQVAVVELRATPRVVVAFGDDRELAARKIQELAPSFERGSYLASFRQANSLLANSFGDHKRIVLLADNQENQWTENPTAPPFLHGVEVDAPKAPARELPNLWVWEPRAQRIFLGDKSLVHFTAKLSHQGPATSAKILLRANEQEVLSRSIELTNQPETLMVQAQWEADPAQWLAGQISVDGSPDALAGDNRVFFSLPPVQEGKVLLLAQSPFLRLALSPEVMRGQWQARVLEPAALDAELAAKDQADVLCLESSYLQAVAARKLLSQYLSDGRGVLLLVNRVTPSINGALRELGFELDSPVELEKDKADRFQFVFSNHPIFHPFRSPDYGNLLEVQIYKYFRFHSGQAVPLAFSEQGAALFFENHKQAGRLFVLAFGLDREQTSWPVHATFIPFLDLSLQAARGEDPTPTVFEPGEIAQLPAPAGVTEMVLRNGKQELSRATVELGKTQLRLPVIPGLYSVTYDQNEETQRMLSVNPSPKESELVYAEAPEALRAWRLERAGEHMASAASTTRVRASLSAVLQQRWWWWMVMAALAMLLCEMALAETKRARA
jgi:hypothetical protein